MTTQKPMNLPEETRALISYSEDSSLKEMKRITHFFPAFPVQITKQPYWIKKRPIIHRRIPADVNRMTENHHFTILMK